MQYSNVVSLANFGGVVTGTNVPAREAYNLLLPVERKFFWDEQPVFGSNIANQIVGFLDGSMLDRMVLSLNYGDFGPLVVHTRGEKIEYIKRSIAGEIDQKAAEAIQAMHELIGRLEADVVDAADQSSKQSDIESFSRLINRGLDILFRSYLGPLKMVGLLTINCGSPDMVYKLGLTVQLKNDIDVCVRKYITDARFTLAGVMRQVAGINQSSRQPLFSVE